MASSGSVPRKAPESCVSCRTIKVRCLKSAEGSEQCDRCDRLGQDCKYETKRRGRKTNAERAARAISHTAPAIAPDVIPFNSIIDVPINPALADYRSALAENSGANANQQNGQLPVGNPLHCNISDFPEITVNHEGNPIQNSQAAISDPLPVHGGPSTGGTASTSLPVDTAPRLDVADYLDPPLPPVGFHQQLGLSQISPPISAPPATISASDNPVALGFISQVESENLVGLFHTRLNPISAYLDPPLHTFEYLRNNAPLLLTAVLAASAKFFRPQYYRNLWEYAQVLVNRAITAGDCSIEVIQSLLTLVSFKAPTDRSAWIKIGMAVRLGYQHGWNRPRTGPLPSDEHEARRLLNAERTWLGECFIEMAVLDNQPTQEHLHVMTASRYARSFGLPTMIRVNEIGDAEAWAREHAHLKIPTDMHLACSLALTEIYVQLERLARAERLNTSFWQSFLDDAEREHEARTTKWFSAAHGDPFELSSRLMLKFVATSSSLVIKHKALEHEVDLPNSINSFFALIPQVVDQMEAIAGAGILVYIHDITSATLSQVTLQIYKLFWRLTVAQKTLAINLIKRIYSICIQASTGDDAAPTAFVARFTQKTLRVLSMESRAPSPTAVALGAGTNAQDDTGFLLDLDDFLRTADTVPDTTQQDEQFWWSLLAPSMAETAFEQFNTQFGI